MGLRTGKSFRELADFLGITKSKVEGFVKQARERGDLPQPNP